MDGMNITNTDVADAVRETALLVDVSISMWAAERSDPKAMAKVKEDAGAVGNVGRVVKNMLAGADTLLRDTRTAFHNVRLAHYAITLPWTSDPQAVRQRGPRLLPTMLWQRYTTVVGKAREAAYEQLDEFVDAYPAAVSQAKANLGLLAEVNYPTAEEIRTQFRVRIDFEPIPAGAAFKGLPDLMLGKLSYALAAKQARMIQAANAAMWEAVHERVGHIAAVLGDPDKSFKATTIENVRDLITLIPGWNVTADQRAAEIAADIEQMLAGVKNREQVVKNDDLRRDVAAKAQAVTDKLSSWGL